MKLTGEVDEEKDSPKNKTLSLSYKAFSLFLENKSLVDVAIDLDIPTEGRKIHSDYVTLKI